MAKAAKAQAAGSKSGNGAKSKDFNLEEDNYDVDYDDAFVDP